MGNSTSCPVSLLTCQSIKLEESSDEDVFVKEEYIFHRDMNLVDLTLTGDGYFDQKQKGKGSPQAGRAVNSINSINVNSQKC